MIVSGAPIIKKSLNSNLPEYNSNNSLIILMLAEKIIRESPPRELAEIAYASLNKLEEGKVGA